MVAITLPDGRKVEGIQEDFETMKETWSEYRLKDGTILRFKVVIAEIYRLPDKDPATGKSNFMVKSQQVMSQSSPK